MVDEAFAYALPAGFGDEEVAPLLCAGIIGYRALLPGRATRAGGRLGIYGFGGSAHITAQVALARGARVHVMTRSAQARSWRSALGAASAGGATTAPPEPLDAAILFAPVGTLVPPHWPRSTGAAPWPSPASTSATSRRSTTNAISSRSAPCAA